MAAVSVKSSIIANSVLRASLDNYIAYPTHTRGIIVNYTEDFVI